jgi:hypothetical protein
VVRVQASSCITSLPRYPSGMVINMLVSSFKPSAAMKSTWSSKPALSDPMNGLVWSMTYREG